MAYSEDYRKRVMEYLDEGHTWEQARTTFKISMTAISSWREKYKRTGEVKDAPARRSAYKKLNPAELKSYVEKNPDAYLGEIAQEFGCSGEAVRKALKRLGITRKKRAKDITNKNESK